MSRGASDHISSIFIDIKTNQIAEQIYQQRGHPFNPCFIKLAISVGAVSDYLLNKAAAETIAQACLSLHLGVLDLDPLIFCSSW